MKNQCYFSARFSVTSGILIALFIFSFNAFSQSGKKIDAANENASSEKTDESKTDKIFPIPEQQYEYIAPNTVVDFMYELKDRAKRGFRLYKVTAVPGGASESTKEKANKVILAGIVKYDGTEKFDYNFFFAEGEGNPDKKLSSLVSNGWYFCEDVMIYGGGVDEDSVYANTIYKLPTIGNLYLLERTSGEPSGKMYKLLKAGVGVGRNPTPKMQALINESLEDGYKPVTTYFTFDIKSLFTVDQFVGVLMEKQIGEDKPKDDNKINFEYRFVRANRSDGLQKDVLAAGKEGFRVQSMNFNSAVLVREKSNAPAIDYQWLDSDDKKYAMNYAEIMKMNVSYSMGGINMDDSGDFVKNLMLFEKNAAQTYSSEFQTVVMNPKIPKQFKKNPEEYLKTLGDPKEKIAKLQSEGFHIKDIFYSGAVGIILLLEKGRN